MLKLQICHIEAGLRTYDKHSPFPEEINRQLTSKLLIFILHQQEAKHNLLDENVLEDSIIVNGNTVIDALFIGLKKSKKKKH